MARAQTAGYFPRGSILRRVQGERLVGLFYGQRALAIGACYPLPYIGTAEHTRGRERPFKRLAATGKMFETIYFGSRADADRVLAAVRGMHGRVTGTIPEAAGRFPAGTPYSAFDPELMLWTMAVMADSSRTFFELFVRELTPAEREALWSEWVRFGELFGMPREVAPGSAAEFEEWYRAKLTGPDMHLTEEARYIGHATAFEIPMDVFAQPFKRVHDLIQLASLPPVVRELYGLRLTRAQALAVPHAVRALRSGRIVAPGAWRKGRNDFFFDSVARVEKRRIERGRPTPGLNDPRIAA